MNPVISVKMITYNHEKLIAKAIEGVLQQKTTYPYELVIGEDCSKDKTQEIVLDYQRHYPDIIRVITSDHNVGLKVNSLRTTQACRGKYIAFCEGDDYWINENKLQLQCDYLEIHEDCGFVFTNYDMHFIGTDKYIPDVIKQGNFQPEDMTVEKVVNGKAGILTCTVMMRRNLFLEIKQGDPYIHTEGNFLMGDTQVWADAVAMMKAHYLPERMAVYNRSDESATMSKNILKRIKFGISNMELRLYLCKKYRLHPKIYNRIEKLLIRYKLSLAFHTHNATMAREIGMYKEEYTIYDRLMYFGAVNIPLYHIINSIMIITQKIKQVLKNIFIKYRNLFITRSSIRIN